MNSPELAAIANHLIQEGMLPSLVTVAASSIPRVKILEFPSGYVMDMMSSYILSGRTAASSKVDCCLSVNQKRNLMECRSDRCPAVAADAGV